MSRYVLLAVASLTCLTACPGGKKCTPTTCSTGCCDAADTCQTGTQYNACGTSGATCAVCVLGQSCSAGVCGLSGLGGGTATGGGMAVGGGTATGGGGGTVTAATFVNNFLGAWCARLTRCGTWASDPASALECVELAATQFDADLRQSLQRGAITLNQAVVERCFAQLSSPDCDTFHCPSSIFIGQISDGARCDTSHDCATPGSTCNGALTCGRTCGPSGGLNQPCAGGNGYGCDSGLYCEPNSGTCRPRLAAGSQCRKQGDCDAASLCNGTTCVALPTAGQPCGTSYPQCASSAYCAGALCAAKKGAGASCSYGQCVDGLGCVEGVCRAGGVGAVCRTTGDCATTQDLGLTCDEVMRTCQAYTFDLPLGATCTGSTSYCSEVPCRNAQVNPDGGVGTPGTCEAPQLTDACSDGSSCPNHAACLNGHCAASATGAPCVSSHNCLATDYCNSQRSCAPRFALNALCDTAHDSCTRHLVCADLDTEPFVYRCRARGAAGTACRSDAGTSRSSTCLDPYGCQAGQCVHAGRLGEPCRAGCFAGACVGGDGGLTYDTGTCVPPRPNDAACSNSAGCLSGRCASNTYRCAPVCP